MTFLKYVIVLTHVDYILSWTLSYPVRQLDSQDHTSQESILPGFKLNHSGSDQSASCEEASGIV